MLRPIKNFLTYLQKNANGATIFGVSSNTNNNNMNVDEMMNQENVLITNGIDNDNNDQENLKEIILNEIEIDKSSHYQNDNLINTNKLKPEEEEMVFTRNIVEKSTSLLENQIDSLNDQNLSKEQNETTQSSSNDENFSISTIDISFSTDENDKTADSLLSLNEVIVDNSLEQNNLIDDIETDPLAIDDHLPSITTTIDNNNSNNHMSTTNQDGIIMIIDIGDFKGISLQNDIKNDDEEYCVTSRLTELVEEQEVRSDGSDSGLGSETSILPTTTTTNTIDNTTTLSMITAGSSNLLLNKIIPRKSNLKRRCNVVDDDDDDDDVDTMSAAITKKSKRSIHFNNVSVYYFPRIQGFACVPSQGGCTLGMGAHHTHYRNFTLAEHAAEQRRVHRQQMQEINPRGSSSDDTDSDEEISEASGSDLDTDANGFLQPVPAKQRRALLKAAGIRKIDTTEKDDCRIIRSSREFCGCSCRGFCDPDTCSCSQAGIKCQVDRPSFPCGCSHDGCANVVGRVEFNPNRVRTHFIHTIMRLELENKQKRPDTIDSPMLNYSNNHGSGFNVVTTMNNLNSNIYNTTNHIRSQTYGHHMLLQQHIQQRSLQQNPNYMNNNGHNSNNNSNLYSNSLIPTSQMENCIQHPLTTQNSLINHNLPMHNHHQHQHHHHQTPDLQYSFRDGNIMDVNTANRDTTTNMMASFPNHQHHLYSDTYNNNHSYNMNQNSYTNSITTTAAITNSNYSQQQYQQNYINNYTQSLTTNCTNSITTTEIIDLSSSSSAETNTTTSYINLNSSNGNVSCLDDINDILHNHRNLTTDLKTNDNMIYLDDIHKKQLNNDKLIECYYDLIKDKTNFIHCGVNQQHEKMPENRTEERYQQNVQEIVDFSSDLTQKATNLLVDDENNTNRCLLNPNFTLLNNLNNDKHETISFGNDITSFSYPEEEEQCADVELPYQMDRKNYIDIKESATSLRLQPFVALQILEDMEEYNYFKENVKNIVLENGISEINDEHSKDVIEDGVRIDLKGNDEKMDFRKSVSMQLTNGHTIETINLDTNKASSTTSSNEIIIPNKDDEKCFTILDKKNDVDESLKEIIKDNIIKTITT